MTSYSLWPSTNGPSSSSTYFGALVEGVSFGVTSSGYALAGYRIWAAADTDGGARQCALWEVTGSGTGTYVSGSALTSAALVSGWNEVLFTTPIALTSGVEYEAQLGIPSFATYTQSSYYWYSGQDGGNGITNGPLIAFSDTPNGASNQTLQGNPQGGEYSGSSDPTAGFAGGAVVQSNFWLDVIIVPATAPGATVAGAVAAMATVAPAGSVHAGAVVLGSVATVALSAPAGTVPIGAVVQGVTASLVLFAYAGHTGIVAVPSLDPFSLRGLVSGLNYSGLVIGTNLEDYTGNGYGGFVS